MGVLSYSFDGLRHAKTCLFYHVVLATKYRYPVLSGLESDVGGVFRSIDSGGKFRVVEFACDGGGHVHLLLKVRPSVSIGWVVSRLKQLSTRELWLQHGDRFSRFYWKRRVVWSSGYFVESVGCDVDRVIQYIRNQA